MYQGGDADTHVLNPMKPQQLMQRRLNIHPGEVLQEEFLNEFNLTA